MVTNLFVKPQHNVPLRAVPFIECGPGGVAANVACAPFRQALITSQSVTADLGLKPGDLRENIEVDFDQLYELPSGTVMRVGEALIRLTFHCEPCKTVLKLVDSDRILHRRGVFGMFLNSARIAVGDAFAVTEQRLEPIPYAIGERIRWFLSRHGTSTAAVDLVHAIGLPASSGKIIPRMLQKLVLAGGR